MAALISSLMIFIWAAENRNQPTFSTSEYDADMAYMMNSLSVYKSVPYYYADHPGTPVELFGTLLLAVTRPMAHAAGEAPVTYILERPELFFSIADGFITLLSITTATLLVLFAIKVEDLMDLFMAGAIGIAFYVLHPVNTLITLVNWSHNSFTFAIGTLVLFLIYLRLRKMKELQTWETTFIGLAVGTLVAIQVYFSTWVLGVAMMVGIFSYLTRRKWYSGVASFVTLLIGSAAGFIIATFPILHRYREFYWWIKSLIFHQGNYGGGASGIASLSGLRDNFSGLWRGGSWFFLGLILLFGMLIGSMIINRKHLRSRAGWWSVAVGICVLMIGSLLTVIKHPGWTYMLSVTAGIPILLTLDFSTLRERGQVVKLGLLMLSILFLGIYAFNVIRFVERRDFTAKTLQIRSIEYQQIKADYAIDNELNPDSVLTLWSYGTASPCMSLRFGNIYTNKNFTEEINVLCPQDWHYSVWTDQVILPNGLTSFDESDGWDILVVSEEIFSPDELVEYGKVIESNFGSIMYVLAGH